MLILIKLILAHLIGDFLLQPTSWVKEKEKRKASSGKLYIHVLIHGALVLLLLWDLNRWCFAVSLMLVHLLIDLIKLYAQKPWLICSKNGLTLSLPSRINPFKMQANT